MKPETQAWLDKAEGHLKAAGVLIDAGLYSQCVFFCQQAVEVLLKAMWVERASEGLPPRTHNLVGLANTVGLRLSPVQRAFLNDLSRQYAPSRYEDTPVEFSREEAENYYRRAQEIYSWLRQQLS